MSGTRRAAVLAVCMTVVALAAGASGCAAKPSKATTGEDIKIGASLELSGATKSIGTTYLNALNLEVADINKKGVLGGRKIKLIVRDNKTDNTQSVANVNELINTDRVSALIEGGCSQCGLAAVKVVEDKKVPTIALGSASALTNPVDQRQYMFKISPNPDQDAAVLVDALAKQGTKKIGMLYVNNVYGKEGLTAITGETAKKNIKITDAESFNPTDANMSVQVKKIAQTNPDAIVVWAVMPAAGSIAQEIKTANYKGGVYMDAGAGAELFTKGAQAAADGTFMVFPRILAINDVTSTTPQVTAQKAWFTEYSSKYSTYSGFASFAADALRMLAKAISDTKGTDGQKIRDDLENMTFDGYSGLIENTPKEHSGLQPAALAVLVVRNQEWHLAQ